MSKQPTKSWARPGQKVGVEPPKETSPVSVEPQEPVDQNRGASGPTWCPPKPTPAPPPPPPPRDCCDEILALLDVLKTDDAVLSECLVEIKTILIGDPMEECGGIRAKISDIQQKIVEALVKLCKLLELVDGADGIKAKISETLECVKVIKDKVSESFIKLCDIKELANCIPLIKMTVDQIFMKICEMVSQLLLIKQDTSLIPGLNAMLNTISGQTALLPTMANQMASCLEETGKLCQILDKVSAIDSSINGSGGVKECVAEIKLLTHQNATALASLIQQGSEQNACLASIKTLLEGLRTDLSTSFAKLDAALLCLTQLKSESAQQLTALAHLQTGSDGQTQCLTELKSESAQQLTALAHLQTELDDQAQSLTELKSESDQHTASLGAVNSKLDSQGQSLTLLTAQSGQELSILGHLQTELDEQGQCLTELKSESDQHTASLALTNSKLDAQSSSLAQLKTQVNNVDNAIGALENQLASVKNDTTAIKSCTDVLKTDVNDIQGNVGAILQCLSALKEAQFNNRLCLDSLKSQMDGLAEVLAEIKCCVCSCPPKSCCAPATTACVETCAPANNCGTVCSNKGRAPTGITTNVQTVSIKCIDDDLVLSFQVTICNDLPIDSTVVEGGILTGFQISDALALQGNIDGLNMDDICVENELQASPPIDSLNNPQFVPGNSSEFFAKTGIDFKPGDKYTITYSMRIKTTCITCLNHQVLFSATNSNVKCWSLCEPINLCTLKSCRN